MNFKDNFVIKKASETWNKFQENRQLKQGITTKKTRIIMGAGVLVLAATIAAFSINASLTVYTLTANGIQAGYIDKPAEIAKTIETVVAEIQKETGVEQILCDTTKVAYTKAKVSKRDVEVLSSAELKKALSDPALYSASTWVVKIDGKSILSATTEVAAKAILEDVKKAYRSESAQLISASFKQNVTITNEFAAVSLIMDPKKATSFILTGTVEPKTYVVKSGDTMWDIAAKTNMKTAELTLANPGFEPDKLKIGQSLNLFDKKPYVTVITKEKVAEKKAIDFKTVYENTGALYKGETKIKSAGVLGSEATEMEVIKENGIWQSTKVLTTKVIAEPVTQVALKGTKSLSTYTGTGILSSPLSGAISSGFGSRGGSRHTGIDIPRPKGSAIHAADDGVVISARYDGAYGNLIKLNHGDGLQTWYAHCSSFNVSVGDIVKKGDVIGAVGTTGRSTGYHLHFEVRINGVPVNPLKYL